MADDLVAPAFPETTARRTLLASLVIVGMGHSVLFAVLAPLGREIGLTELQIGSIISASSLAVFLSSPIWGRASDRWGRKRVMLIGLGGYALGTVLFASLFKAALLGWVVGVPAWIALVVARILNSCVMSATMPASSAYMADLTDITTRTKGMGAVAAANNLGAILGPALGGALAAISLLAPLWCAAGLALLNGAFVLRFLPESPQKRAAVPTHARIRYRDPRIVRYLVIGVLMFMGFAIVQQTMAFRLQDALGLSAVETAQTFALAMILMAGSSLAAQSILVQRLELEPFTLLRIAIPLLAVSYAALAVSDTRNLLFGSMGLLGLGMGLAGPGFMAGASLAVSPEEQGSVAGVAGSCPPLGFVIGPLIGTALYQLDPVFPYLFALGVYVLLIPLCFRLKRG